MISELPWVWDWEQLSRCFSHSVRPEIVFRQRPVGGGSTARVLTAAGRRPQFLTTGTLHRLSSRHDSWLPSGRQTGREGERAFKVEAMFFLNIMTETLYMLANFIKVHFCFTLLIFFIFSSFDIKQSCLQKSQIVLKGILFHSNYFSMEDTFPF